jgi:hypothetical protein
MDFEYYEPSTAKPATASSKAVEELGAAWLLGSGPAAANWAHDGKHRRKCTTKPCVRCNYVESGPRLAALSPMIPASWGKEQVERIPADKLLTAQGCWLASAKVDGVWGGRLSAKARKNDALKISITIDNHFN